MNVWFITVDVATPVRTLMLLISALVPLVTKSMIPKRIASVSTGIVDTIYFLARLFSCG